MEWLNNPWFIGIGGGILSGFIVTFASRKLLTKRDRREYAQKVLGANREVIYAIRPGVSEGLVPSKEVIDSLTKATARKFGVDRSDLHTSFEIAQELMKEVMDSSFISAKTKEEYCTQLSPLSHPQLSKSPEENRATEPREPRRSPGIEEYRSRMVTTMSLMLGLLTATMTIFLAVSKSGLFADALVESKDRLVTLLLPAVATMVAAVISVFMISLKKEVDRRVRDRSRKTDREKSTEDGDE